MRISPSSGRAKTEFTGLLGRLRRDPAGNTLFMMAIATIPVVAMVGAGVDISRGYLIKARLQQACDAGALATRRAMASTTMDANAVAQGRRFFDVNFSSTTAGTTSSTFTLTGAASGEVTGAATAVVPMTITRAFGPDTITLTAACSARLEIPNTDVMFVLDTTGSMKCIPSDTSSSGICDGGSSSKIAGIRSAVMDFYDTMATAIPVGAQLRYGFVPYSSTVNVGDLLSSAWLPDTYAYRSRKAVFKDKVYIATVGTPTETTETYGSLLNSTQCGRYGANVSYPTLDGAARTSGSPPNDTTLTTVTFRNYSASRGANTGTCSRTKTVTTSTYVTKYKFSNWVYDSVPMSTSTFKSGASVRVASGTPGSTDYVDDESTYDLVQLAALPTYTGAEENTTWTGCIEERDTVADATFSYGSLPSGAYDLDIDALPSSNQTMWRPMWPQVIWAPAPNGFRNDIPVRPFDYSASGYSACPSPAMKLSIVTRSAVQSYVNGLVAIGGTYHDTGMIWGARLISPTGIFSSENATAPNGQPINRNIVFMTDGMMAPNENIYGLYGFEALDERVSGGSSDLTNRHNSRFQAMCDAARARGINIWVVGFGTTVTQNLKNCAPNRWFQANDTAQLKTTFKAIANQVARLRLSQ